MKKLVLSEKNLVIVLFVVVFIIFSFAKQDTEKIEKMYSDYNSSATSFDKPDNQGNTNPQAATTSLTPTTEVR